jgi:hypothetical protein
VDALCTRRDAMKAGSLLAPGASLAQLGLPGESRLYGTAVPGWLEPGTPVLKRLERQLGLRTEWLPPQRLARLQESDEPALVLPVLRFWDNEHRWHWLQRLALDEVVLLLRADTPFMSEAALVQQHLRVGVLHGSPLLACVRRLSNLQQVAVSSERAAAHMLMRERLQGWVTLRRTADWAQAQGLLDPSALHPPLVIGASSFYLAAPLGSPQPWLQAARSLTSTASAA